MGKIYKILVCGKKGCGKTKYLEQLIYNRLPDKYYPTIEDIYVANWEKDKYCKEKEKFRFYDTKGMENSSDMETIETYRYLFTCIDACIFIYQSNDSDSYDCIDKIRAEIEREKIKEKSKEQIHYLIVDLDLNQHEQATAIGQQLTTKQQKYFTNSVSCVSIDNREQICKSFSDLANNLTQIITKKSSINIVDFKKPKVFSSNK